jgi:hypothetical protein
MGKRQRPHFIKHARQHWLHWQVFNVFPACLAFSAQQNEAARRSLPFLRAALSLKGSGEAEHLGNILQNRIFAALTPEQGDHPGVGLDLVDAFWQSSKGFEQPRVLTGFTPRFHHTPGLTCQ